MNLLRYTFSNLCHERKSLELSDESYKIFINAKGIEGSENQDLLNFIDFINTGKGNDAFTEKLAEAVRLNHEDADKAVRYMTWEEEMQTYAIGAAIKARAEGIIEGKLETARKLKLKGMSIEDIVDVTGLTAEQIALA